MSGFKKLCFWVGLLFILAYFGRTFELRDPNTPRLPIPTVPPAVDVKVK